MSTKTIVLDLRRIELARDRVCTHIARVPRYHFHFRTSHGDIADKVGVELASDFDAGNCGLEAVRSLLVSAIAEREMLDLSGRVRIVDAAGRDVIEIAYADLLQVG